MHHYDRADCSEKELLVATTLSAKGSSSVAGVKNRYYMELG